MDEMKTLNDIGFTSSTARAQNPAAIGMCWRLESEINPYIHFFLEPAIVLNNLLIS